MKPDDPLLDTEAAARYLSVSKAFLCNDRSTGRNNVPYYKVGRSVRYRQSALDAWLSKRAHVAGQRAA